MARVLIVEPNVLNAWSIERKLRQNGHEVIEILNNGEDLVMWIEASPVDLIIMEVDLQGKMTGVEAARTILQTKKLPTLLMSANEVHEYNELVQGNNSCSFIQKPFCYQSLEAEVCRLLQVR